MQNKPTISILSRVRSEGYREGRSQAGEAHYDDAFARGQEDVRAEAPSRLRWFLAGQFSVAVIALAVRLI